MTHFFAHLCLYLQMIDIPVPLLATQVILEAYLQVLEAAGQRELIAMYAVPLGDNAVERYEMFLTSLELIADVNDRRLALTCAREDGLDVHEVAVVAAKLTIDRAFESGQRSGMERMILRWNRATVILRYFLGKLIVEDLLLWLRMVSGAGRVLLAKNLVEMLPRELPSIDQPEERATKYLNHRQFFTIQDSLDRVMECQNLEVPIMKRNTRAACLINQAYDRVVKLLRYARRDRRPSLPRPNSHSADIYLPELILRLHVMLYASREHIPENLKRALELANTVADSRYRLYNDSLHIAGWRLGEALTQCAEQR
ncbi:hypothetical protein DEU56DRAFT_918408 [Suillus clintonianus]|uniref:uncharacterized protein n=1 Tax=Suillus clintonianus TaxID=1904413 RepID=UPI001B87B188|nr:uncharacterized protein DEU56DRAFT_918408 [Suillus clintonianus]KAG2120265.1 hypothetical protein DEU56DRAFT_918408 [Suillus clintonianus]